MRVAVIGHCASGKTTIVAALQARGYDAYVVSQEHSAIADLWRHRSPDRLVMLDVDYEVVQARRGRSWPEWIYDLQRQRLEKARHHANVIVNTGTLSIEETISRIVQALDPAE